MLREGYLRNSFQTKYRTITLYIIILGPIEGVADVLGLQLLRENEQIYRILMIIELQLLCVELSCIIVLTSYYILTRQFFLWATPILLCLWTHRSITD